MQFLNIKVSGKTSKAPNCIDLFGHFAQGESGLQRVEFIFLSLINVLRFFFLHEQFDYTQENLLLYHVVPQTYM